MVNWQLTATTIYCDAVDNEVTLMVYKDGSATCTGYSKYGKPGKEILAKRRSKRLKQQLKCDGPECYRVTQYKDRLFTKEVKKGAREQSVDK